MEDKNNYDEEFEELVLISIILKGKRPRAQKFKTERFYDYKQTYQETDLQIVLLGVGGRCNW